LTTDEARATEPPSPERATPNGHAAAQAQTRASAERGESESRHERPSVTVDVVILTMRKRRLEALLIKRKRWPYEGLWAIPGGFVEPNESLEDAARRELEEETRVRDVYLEQLYTFGDPHRDPRERVITVVYYALIRADELHVVAGDDAAESGWFPVYSPPPLAFDHENILAYTMQRLRGKLEYTTIGYQMLAPEFTLSELQEVYEAILNRPIDKRNFRKKVLSTGILEQTSHTRKTGQHRPAALYRFSPRADRGA
jgi:8-oxo-dGTP diphosphatase